MGDPLSGTRVGRYEVDRRLAERVDSLWWLAHLIESPEVQVVLQRVVRDPGSTPFAYADFLDRARAQARIVHPNVVRIHEVGTAGDDLLVVHAYVPGWSLESIVVACAQHRHPLPLGFGCAVMVDALRGLDAAHRSRSGAPLVHGALDLSEIRVTTQGAGLVKGFAHPRAPVHGRYRSPEELRNEALVPASDVFSAGLLLYELLSGRPVFADLAEDAPAEALLFAPLPDLREVSPGVSAPLSELVMSMIDRSRSRPATSAGEMARRLEAESEALPFSQEERTELLTWLGRHAASGEDARVPERSFHPPASSAAEHGAHDSSRAATSEAPARQGRRTGRPILWVFVLGLALSVGLAAIGDGSVLRTLIGEPMEPMRPLPPSALVPRKMPPNFFGPEGAQKPAGSGEGSPTRRIGRDEATGTVTLVTEPVAEVRHRGQVLGKTPLFQAKVPVGLQTLEFVLPDGSHRKVPVQVEEGKAAAYRFDLRAEPAPKPE